MMLAAIGSLSLSGYIAYMRSSPTGASGAERPPVSHSVGQSAVHARGTRAAHTHSHASRAPGTPRAAPTAAAVPQSHQQPASAPAHTLPRRAPLLFSPRRAPRSRIPHRCCPGHTSPMRSARPRAPAARRVTAAGGAQCQAQRGELRAARAGRRAGARAATRARAARTSRPGILAGSKALSSAMARVEALGASQTAAARQP